MISVYGANNDKYGGVDQCKICVNAFSLIDFFCQKSYNKHAKDIQMYDICMN